MRANQLQKTLGGTPLWRKTRPAIDHLDALLAFDGAFALQAKDLSHLAPVPAQIVVEIRTSGDLAPLQTTMAFLDLFKALPGAPIGLLVFKKELQIRSRDRGIVFDDHHHVASPLLDQTPKLMVALGGIGSPPPFAPSRLPARHSPVDSPNAPAHSCTYWHTACVSTTAPTPRTAVLSDRQFM